MAQQRKLILAGITTSLHGINDDYAGKTPNFLNLPKKLCDKNIHTSMSININQEKASLSGILMNFK